MTFLLLSLLEQVMKFRAAHQNFNVTNLDASIKFYNDALGLTEIRRKEKENFTIVYLKNDESQFELELTYLKNHPQKYDLGEEEFHLAFKTDDFENAHLLHEKMNVICYENKEMGIYFIQDPDGYWIEIVPEKR